MTIMRAKMKIDNVEVYDTEEYKQEVLTMSAVCKSDYYDEDGYDEDNTYSKFTPSASLEITIQNPELFEKFNYGDTFYVDFIKVEKEK